MAIIGINTRKPIFLLDISDTNPMNDGAINIPTYPADETIPNAEPIALSSNSSTIITYRLMASEAEVKPCINLDKRNILSFIESTDSRIEMNSK